MYVYIYLYAYVTDTKGMCVCARVHARVCIPINAEYSWDPHALVAAALAGKDDIEYGPFAKGMNSVNMEYMLYIWILQM